MTHKTRLLALAALTAVSAGGLGACASSGGSTSAERTTSEGAASASTETARAPAETTTSGFTDTQLRAFVRAQGEIEPISATLAAATPEQRTAATQQISAILQRNNLTADQYNQIASQANTDIALRNRLLAVAPVGSYSDAQLQSFIAASREIDPINAQLATATPEQRAAATEQIRAILTRNNIDANTYNSIAAQAQANAELANRIRTLAGVATQ
jgi:hypothetical protein